MKHLMLALLLTFGSHALAQSAADYECRWGAETAVEDRGEDFTEDVYSAAPKIIAASACATNGRVSTNGVPPPPKPICTGYGYCTSRFETQPPQMVRMACQAVEVNGVWRCPTANGCAADSQVSANELTAIPEPSSGTRPSKPGTSSNGVSDGVGGR